MKLLLDQNLSRYLLTSICEIWPDSSHVALIGMNTASDKEIWAFAARNQYIILSKDNDFVQMATFFGAPPKVILLSIGNASTDDIKHCLLMHKKIINEFCNNLEEALLIIP